MYFCGFKHMLALKSFKLCAVKQPDTHLLTGMPLLTKDISCLYCCWYQIRYWQSADVGSQRQQIVHPTDTTLLISSLLPYTEYTITMLAFSAAGDGPYSNPPLIVKTLQSGELQLHDIRLNCCNFFQCEKDQEANRGCGTALAKF